MKIKINRNYIWSQVIVEQLALSGIIYACISPGSRSTPLTLAFDKNKKIKTFVLPDERSSSFFALGLAKKSKSPVAIVTTSGTAVAELYPAIIEAYQQRVPLIICTADRPAYLRNTGANQTINQNNIYKNHIRFFCDLGLPDLNISSFKRLVNTVNLAVEICLYKNKGPVHLNLPFKKPLEPVSYTDSISKEIFDRIHSKKFYKNMVVKKTGSKIRTAVKAFAENLSSFKNGIIICGGGIDDNLFPVKLAKLSQALGYPVFADGTSNIRFGGHSKSNIICNYSGFASLDTFRNKLDADIIIQLGKTPTSKQLLNYFKSSNAKKYLIDEYGDLNDPSKTASEIIEINPSDFCDLLIDYLPNKPIQINRRLNRIKELNLAAAIIKKEIIENAGFPFEGRIVTELFSRLRNNCNIMVSNSLPIRDLDYFVSASQKKINVFANRGASGIDGITSTALGIAAASNEPTLLLTGDLAFYHDMNGLLAAMKYSIPLTIVLINNNGGGIFEALPVAKSKNGFREYFKTPHDLDFAHFVIGYNGYYFNIRSWDNFKDQFPKTFSRTRFTVLEIKTDAKESALIRKRFFDKVAVKINSMIENDNSN